MRCLASSTEWESAKSLFYALGRVSVPDPLHWTLRKSPQLPPELSAVQYFLSSFVSHLSLIVRFHLYCCARFPEPLVRVPAAGTQLFVLCTAFHLCPSISVYSPLHCEHELTRLMCLVYPSLPRRCPILHPEPTDFSWPNELHKHLTLRHQVFFPGAQYP